MNTPDHVAAVVAKAEAGGVRAAELAALRRRLRQLGEQRAGLLPGEVLEPVPDLPRLDELPQPAPGQARDVLDRLVIVKLNGGLGTSMGLSGPKSLLQVKPGASFLDVLARQVLALRERHGARLPLVLMSSAATRGPSLDALRRYDTLPVPGVPLDFLQGREPKIRADDLQPVQWPADPELEWCPPGHGDIYTALAASGTLDILLGAGLRYAFVSNSDNLGALADVRIAAWLAAQQVPFALEAVRGTPADPARAATWPATRAGWCCGRRRRCPAATPRSPTSGAGAGTTPTTSGSTCARCRTCRPPTRRHRPCL